MLTIFIKHLFLLHCRRIQSKEGVSTVYTYKTRLRRSSAHSCPLWVPWKRNCQSSCPGVIYWLILFLHTQLKCFCVVVFQLIFFIYRWVYNISYQGPSKHINNVTFSIPDTKTKQHRFKARTNWFFFFFFAPPTWLNLFKMIIQIYHNTCTLTGFKVGNFFIFCLLQTSKK